jgi:hypothetical protein
MQPVPKLALEPVELHWEVPQLVLLSPELGRQAPAPPPPGWRL